MTELPVIIAGGGPVGLTLAMDLGWRGVPSLLFEERVPAEPPNPKCNTTNARSMEHFRRLGCADEIRAAGLPGDHPTHVVYLTRFNGHMLGRLNLPPSAMRRHDRGALDEGWPTPEPQHRISQIFLEPILYQHARTFPGVEIRRGWRVEKFTQHEGYVEVEALEVATGRRETHRARYLVGCDGGRSAVRRQLGIELRGIDVIGRTISVYFRSKELIRHDRNGPAWMYWILNRDQIGNVIALDGKELWLCHLMVPPDKNFDDIDPDLAVTQALGVEVPREILGIERWTSRRLVADRYRDRNVFLAGDAAHIWIPLGGFGMNAGIGDATHLAWVLAAQIHGWAGPHLLDAYETERRPIGDMVSNAAVLIMKNRGPAMQVRDGLEDATPAAESMRRDMGDRIVAADASQFNSIGVQLAYYYDASPINCNDDSPAPAFALDQYAPTSRPGSRAPHLWLPDSSVPHLSHADENRAEIPQSSDDDVAESSRDDLAESSGDGLAESSRDRLAESSGDGLAESSCDEAVASSGATTPHSTARHSLYDQLGRDFTLLRLGPNPPATHELERAFAERRVPLKVLDVPESSALRLYENFPLVIVRPDQHVGWRAIVTPAAPFTIVDTLRGA